MRVRERIEAQNARTAILTELDEKLSLREERFAGVEQNLDHLEGRTALLEGVVVSR